MPKNDENGDLVVSKILAAMVRVLAGRPSTAAPGDMTITAVAVEADVKRHFLTHKHTELKDLFYDLRDNANNPVVAQQALAQAKRNELEDKLSEARDEIRKWKSTANTFARAIHALTIENDALKNPASSSVRPIR